MKLIKLGHVRQIVFENVVGKLYSYCFTSSNFLILFIYFYPICSHSAFRNRVLLMLTMRFGGPAHFVWTDTMMTQIAHLNKIYRKFQIILWIRCPLVLLYLSMMITITKCQVFLTNIHAYDVLTSFLFLVCRILFRAPSFACIEFPRSLCLSLLKGACYTTECSQFSL